MKKSQSLPIWKERHGVLAYQKNPEALELIFYTFNSGNLRDGASNKYSLGTSATLSKIKIN